MPEQANKTTYAKICLRQGNNEYCNKFNGTDYPILLSGEPIFNTETKVLKIGDGVNAYNNLESYYLGYGIKNIETTKDNTIKITKTDNSILESNITNDQIKIKFNNLETKIENEQLKKSYSPTDPSIEIQEVEISKTTLNNNNNEVLVNISINNNPNLIDCYLKIYYDEKLELTNISTDNATALTSTELNSTQFTPSGDLSLNPIILFWDSLEENSGNGIICTLTFKINELEQQDHNYYFIQGTCVGFTESANEINNNNIYCKDGFIKVLPAIGDINNDGAINAKDITLLRRYIAGGYNVNIENVSIADINNDGAANAKDITLLRRYIAGGCVQLFLVCRNQHAPRYDSQTNRSPSGKIADPDYCAGPYFACLVYCGSRFLVE